MHSPCLRHLVCLGFLLSLLGQAAVPKLSCEDILALKQRLTDGSAEQKLTATRHVAILRDPEALTQLLPTFFQTYDVDAKAQAAKATFAHLVNAYVTAFTTSQGPMPHLIVRDYPLAPAFRPLAEEIAQKQRDEPYALLKQFFSTVAVRRAAPYQGPHWKKASQTWKQESAQWDKRLATTFRAQSVPSGGERPHLDEDISQFCRFLERQQPGLLEPGRLIRLRVLTDLLKESYAARTAPGHMAGPWGDRTHEIKAAIEQDSRAILQASTLRAHFLFYRDLWRNASPEAQRQIAQNLFPLLLRLEVELSEPQRLAELRAQTEGLPHIEALVEDELLAGRLSSQKVKERLVEATRQTPIRGHLFLAAASGNLVQLYQFLAPNAVRLKDYREEGLSLWDVAPTEAAKELLTNFARVQEEPTAP